MFPNHRINFVSSSNNPQQIVFVQPIEAVQPNHTIPVLPQILTQYAPLTTTYVMLCNPINQTVLQDAFYAQTPLVSHHNVYSNPQYIDTSNVSNGLWQSINHQWQINTINGTKAPFIPSSHYPDSLQKTSALRLTLDGCNSNSNTNTASVHSTPSSSSDASPVTHSSTLDTRSDGFKCDQCQRVFVRKVNLNAHKKIHTAFAFVCTFCNKKFARKSNLQQHTRIHTNERPYLCTYCPRTFRQQHSLKGHLRTHTGEKPYQCQHCTKRFAAKCNLKVHLRTHTGEKPYQCVTCNKGYASKSGFNAHQRKFHSNSMI